MQSIYSDDLQLKKKEPLIALDFHQGERERERGWGGLICACGTPSRLSNGEKERLKQLALILSTTTLE